MTNRLVGITIDCSDPARMASFWSRMLDIAETREHGQDSDWSIPEPKAGKTRIHLDIEVDSIDAGHRQVESLGGTWSGVRHDYDEGAVMIMQDPEGHEFCVVEYYDSNTEPPTT